MTPQLSVIYTTPGATLYCVVRTGAGDVWNLTAEEFQTPLDVDLAAGSYSVVLADAGLDLYVGSVPEAIPAGTYRFTYYLQSGATPATGDLTLKSRILDWNGIDLTRPGESVSTADTGDELPLEMIQGDDYTASARVPTWTITGYVGPILSGAIVVVRFLNATDYHRHGSRATADLEVDATVYQTGGVVTVLAPISESQTAALSIVRDNGVTHYYQIIATVGGKPLTLKTGPVVVTRGIKSPA